MLNDQKSSSSLIAIKNYKILHSQDANALAIDAMLVNFRNLMKKLLQLKKCQKQYLEIQPAIVDKQINQKITAINSQTTNLALSFPNDIPPDKRMTNLLYLRIVKQITCYQKLMPSLIDILPILQQKYSEQIKNQEYSIITLYKICQKKVIQQINLLKNKNITQLASLVNSSWDQVLIINQNQNIRQSVRKNQLNGRKSFAYNQGQRNLQWGYNNSNQVIDAFNERFNQETIVTPKKIMLAHDLEEVYKRASKGDLFLDFKQKVIDIFSHIYSPLDIGDLEITQNYVPTLRQQDNVDLLYRKVNKRNKKCLKQCRQFQTQYSTFIQRKQEILKRKWKRSELKHLNSDNILERQSQPLKNIQKKQSFQKSQQQNIIKRKKYSFQNIQALKTSTKEQLLKKQGRSLSRFRDRIQSSLVSSKQVCLYLLSNNNTKNNNITASIGKKDIKGSIGFRIKKKESTQSNQSYNKQNKNNTQYIPDKNKVKKPKQYDIKQSKQKPDKKILTLKEQIHQSKDVFGAKRLKL